MAVTPTSAPIPAPVAKDASFLRREAYIRQSGILLTLSPIGNFLWSAACSGVHRWYRPHMLYLFLMHVPAVLWFLWGMTFTAGTLMLKGKRSSWNFTLFILGVNIVFGITTFNRDIHGGWVQPTLSLVVNIALFALIYVQEFHQRLESKLTAAREAARAATRAIQSRPLALTPGFELPVYFEETAGAPRAWATIAEVTHTGIRLRSVDGEAPRQIEFRAIELALERGLALRARFSAKVGPDFFFRFTDMDMLKLSLLHRWAKRISARAPANRAA